MKTELIPQERFRTFAWSGGETTELFILPDGASYAKRDFRARISSAAVSLERSVFTHLPGVTRYLSPLECDFRLRIDGNPPILLRRGEILRFDGGSSVECEGRGRDLNLMLKNCAGNLLYTRTGSLSGGQTGFVYAQKPLPLLAGRERAVIPQGCLLRVLPDAGETVALRADGAFYAFILDLSF